MDYKKSKAPTNTVTHDLMDFCKGTDNVYESIVKKLKEFATSNDSLEETFENREQIEISRYYERLPKPTLIAAQEFEDDKIYYRNPAKDKERLNSEL